MVNFAGTPQSPLPHPFGMDWVVNSMFWKEIWILIRDSCTFFLIFVLKKFMENHEKSFPHTNDDNSLFLWCLLTAWCLHINLQLLVEIWGYLSKELNIFFWLKGTFPTSLLKYITFLTISNHLIFRSQKKNH